MDCNSECASEIYTKLLEIRKIFYLNSDFLFYTYMFDLKFNYKHTQS